MAVTEIVSDVSFLTVVNILSLLRLSPKRRKWEVEKKVSKYEASYFIPITVPITSTVNLLSMDTWAEK